MPADAVLVPARRHVRNPRLIQRASAACRCAAVRQQCRTGLSACLDLVPVDGDYEIGSRREVTVDRAHANAGLGAMNFGSMGRTSLDEATAFTIVAAL
jgi:hypothetical protein